MVLVLVLVAEYMVVLGSVSVGWSPSSRSLAW